MVFDDAERKGVDGGLCLLSRLVYDSYEMVIEGVDCELAEGRNLALPVRENEGSTGLRIFRFKLGLLVILKDSESEGTLRRQE